jgi:predicted DNA-binding protein YlxM (UPF0122 family)
MQSIYLNEIKTNKLICKEEIFTGGTTEKFEPNDEEYTLLQKTKSLTFNQRELLELSYDYSLREIEATFKVNYLYIYRTTKKARETLLNGDLTAYKNKRLKHKVMTKEKEENYNDSNYYENLDKRSREYKTYMAGKRSVGLGDTVEKIIEATGMKYLAKVLVGEDCGCAERKAKLNEFFKYREKPNCLDASQKEDYKGFIDSREIILLGAGKAEGKLSVEDVSFICGMYAEVFNRKVWKPTCSSCQGTALTLIAMIYKLDVVYYNNI